MIRRCPQCGTATDDIYGFCIKCGYEFPKLEKNQNACPLCGYPNPEEADYCVKCGTPLIFKNQPEGNNGALNPIVIKKEVINDSKEIQSAENIGKTSPWLILFGYVFSILGGVLGFIIAVYLSTRKDPIARKHGHIQLAIFAFYIILIAALYLTGNIPQDVFSQYQEMLAGNFSSLQR